VGIDGFLEKGLCVAIVRIEKGHKVSPAVVYAHIEAINLALVLLVLDNPDFWARKPRHDLQKPSAVLFGRCVIDDNTLPVLVALIENGEQGLFYVV
jgi:hypothetical protein